MRPLGILLAGWFLAGLIAAPCVQAEDWSLWPVASGKKSSSKKEPGFLDKITTGTKNFFTKTRDALTPGSTTTKKKQAAPWTTNNPSNSSNSSTAKSAPAKKGLFDSWFAKDEPKKPETAAEWIALPRPE